MRSLILFYFISFIFQLLENSKFGNFYTIVKTLYFRLKNSTFFIFVSFFKLKKNEEGLLNTMYDTMTEEESFLKCLCKSIIEFLICNFSWKWPCSNKSSQITEYQTLSATCFFSESKLYSFLWPSLPPQIQFLLYTNQQLFSWPQICCLLVSYLHDATFSHLCSTLPNTAQ